MEYVCVECECVESLKVTHHILQTNLKKGKISVKVALVTLGLMMGPTCIGEWPLPLFRVDEVVQRTITNLRYSCSRCCRSSTS